MIAAAFLLLLLATPAAATEIQKCHEVRVQALADHAGNGYGILKGTQGTLLGPGYTAAQWSVLWDAGYDDHHVVYTQDVYVYTEPRSTWAVVEMRERPCP